MVDMKSAGQTRTVKLYNLTSRGRTIGNGWLVRVVTNGQTTFVRFGSDEAAARAYAKVA